MREIGINITSDVSYGTDSFFDCVADSGFNRVFTYGNDEKFIEHISKKCAESKLTYESIHAPSDNINDLWFKDTGRSVIENLKNTVDLASEYGAQIVVLHVSSKENCPHVTDAGLEFFDELVNLAEKKNIKLAIENQRKLGNIATILETYGKDSPVGFCWDVGHEKCFANGKEYLPLFGDRCITTHIHDNNCQYNVDEHLLPFDGNIDFRRTAELINTYKYDGPLVLEIDLPHENSDKYSSLSMEQFVHKAYAAINRLRIISEY